MTSEKLLRWSLALLSLMVGTLLLVIVFFILDEGLELLTKVGAGGFLLESEWEPYAGKYGLQAMLLASIALMLGSVLVAVPLSVVTAAFMNFYLGKRVAHAARRLVEVAAGIPSVVYGLWGLTVLVPLIAEIKQPGTSLLAGILCLAIMIFPTIVVVIDAGFQALPRHYRLNAAALGMSRRCIVFSIAVPAVKSYIVTGATLGAARAIGETMVVMMITGNIVKMPESLFQPVRALTSSIALEMAYALGDHRAALYVSSFFLLLLVMALVIANQLASGPRRSHV